MPTKQESILHKEHTVLKLHIHTTAFVESMDEIGLRKTPAVKAQ